MMKWERSILGFLLALSLLFWLAICITDVNHPPGMRAVRLCVAGGVLLIGLLEFFRPWNGFYIFLLLWPQWDVIKLKLGQLVSPFWYNAPPIASMFAATLGVAIFLRLRRQRQNVQENLPPTSIAKSLLVCRISLWLLVCAWLISLAFCMLRLQGMPEGWLVQHGDWRHLLDAAIRTDVIPLVSTLEVLPSLLLGLLLLNFLAQTPHPEALAGPARKLMVLGCLGASIAALQFASQLIWHWYWPFMEWAPGGPFHNRNSLAPFLVVFGVLFFALQTEKLWLRILTWCCGLGLLTLACLSGSRNGLLLVLCIPLLALFYKAGWKRALCAAILPCLIGAILFLGPLSKGETPVALESLDRTNASIKEAREGKWGSRAVLYKTAFRIFMAYPLTGSGPETFSMLANTGGRFKDAEQYELIVRAHSMPLNILAELGLIGMAAWVTLWIVLPFVWLLRWGNANLAALAALLVGLGNLFDTSWQVPGMPTVAVLLLFWALIWEIAAPSFAAESRKTGAVEQLSS
jgi:hypothetical protein